MQMHSHSPLKLAWDRPHAIIDKFQQRDKLGRMGQARKGPPRPERKPASYDDFYISSHRKQSAKRLPHVGMEDDNDLSEVKVLKKTWHLPDNVKILEKPSPIFMTRSMQSAMLIKPPSVITLKSMKEAASGGGAALGNTSVNIPGLCESVLSGKCDAIRITAGQAQEDDLVSLQQALERRQQVSVEFELENDGPSVLELQGQFLTGLGGDALITALPLLGNLQHLSLARSALPSSSIDPVAQALVNNTLMTLDLTGAGIDDTRAEELAHGLKLNTSLVSLSLPGNQIYQAGALQLTHALKQHPSLQRLDVSLNRLMDQGATWLANLIADSPPNLIFLSADYNSISDAGAHSIMAMFAHQSCALQTLSLRGNQLRHVRFEACQAIMMSRTLTTLNLANNQISNMVLLGSAVLRSRSLRVVNLSHNLLTDSSFTSLPSTRFRYWETAGASPARIRAWLLELAERTAGSGKTSKLELLDLSHNQVSDDGAVIVVRALLPLRKKQKKEQRKAQLLLADGRLRRVLPRVILEQNDVQATELLGTLRLLDSNVAEAEKHWLAYTERRKEEFWSDWHSKHGIEAQKRRLENLWFIASNSRAGMLMRRKMRVVMKGLGRVGGDLDMDDDGMDEIELAEEEHRLALLSLKTEEEEKHAEEEAKVKRLEEKESRLRFEAVREEFEKTGNQDLLKGLSRDQRAAAVKYRSTHAHKAVAGRPSQPDSPRSNDLKSNFKSRPRSSNLNSPVALRSQRSSTSKAPNLLHA